jgi:serine/threonine protein phosphatase PrpC
MLTVTALSHPGHSREINEDAVLTDAPIGLVAIADGMGGHNAGELASGMALDALGSFLRKSAETRDFTWPCGVNFKQSMNANRLAAAIQISNRLVFRKAEESPKYTGMGTTVVAALVEGAALTFASVGDSRIYQMAGTTLRQLSTDDSWIEMLARESGGNTAALRNHPMRDVLTKVVGARGDLDVLATEVTLEDGQVLLLCTDGLHGAVPFEEMAGILSAHEDLQRTAEVLVQAALDRDGSDNISLVLARYTSS